MNISQEKMDEAEKEIIQIMQKYDIQYDESALDSGFPFEKFQKMCNQLISDFKNDWPIG